MPWLEPYLEYHLNEVIERCCADEEVNNLYNRFMGVTYMLKTKLDKDSVHYIHEIEEIMNVYTGLIIRLSYRTGFEEGLNIASYNTRK